MSSIGHMILKSSSRPNPNPIGPGTSSFQSQILFFLSKAWKKHGSGSISRSRSSWRQTWGSGSKGKIDRCSITGCNSTNRKQMIKKQKTSLISLNCFNKTNFPFWCWNMFLGYQNWIIDTRVHLYVALQLQNVPV